MKVALKLIALLVLTAQLPCIGQEFGPVPDDQMPQRFKETKELSQILKDLGIASKKRHDNGNPFSKDVDVSVNRFTFSSISPSTGTIYGTYFIVQGYMYPAGTFEENGATSGINADGTPEFPDLVVGIWYCYGTRVGETGPTGASSLTTQVFDFNPDDPGSTTIVTNGFERFDTNTTWYRALTGGTGSHSRARGQQAQTAIGANLSGMGNLTMSLQTNPWPLLKK